MRATSSDRGPAPALVPACDAVRLAVLVWSWASLGEVGVQIVSGRLDQRKQPRRHAKALCGLEDVLDVLAELAYFLETARGWSARGRPSPMLQLMGTLVEVPPFCSGSNVIADEGESRLRRVPRIGNDQYPLPWHSLKYGLASAGIGPGSLRDRSAIYTSTFCSVPHATSK